MALDEPKEAQDTSEKDASEETKETSEKTEETFTKSQRDKAISDALAAAGRTAKSLEKREETIKKAEKEAAQKDRERREAELEAARDDPDKLTAIEQRHKREERAAELSRREAELEAREERVKGVEEVAKKAEIREAAMKIALKHGVSLESLINFTDGSTEKMEELAKLLPKSGEEKPLKVDSGKTIGGEGASLEALLSKDWRGMNQQELLEYNKALLKAKNAPTK